MNTNQMKTITYLMEELECTFRGASMTTKQVKDVELLWGSVANAYIPCKASQLNDKDDALADDIIKQIRAKHSKTKEEVLVANYATPEEANVIDHIAQDIADTIDNEILEDIANNIHSDEAKIVLRNCPYFPSEEYQCESSYNRAMKVVK